MQSKITNFETKPTNFV